MTAPTHDDRRAIGVVGSGRVTAGIAQVLAEAGASVLVFGGGDVTVDGDIAQAVKMLERRAAKGQITADAAAAAKSRIRAVSSIDGLSDCGIVVESMLADAPGTRSMISRLEAVLPPRTMIGCNTSSHTVTSLAAQALHPDRIIGLHFFDPVPLIRVVEMIPGLRTSAETVSAGRALVERIGHAVIAVKDSPGFLVNHIGRALLTEAAQIADEQIAGHDTIDSILRTAGGFRMGAFELLDYVGLDVSLPVMEQLYEAFHHEPRLRPAPSLRLRVDGGMLGRKSDQGFYRYENGKPVAEPTSASAASQAPPPVWIDPTDPTRYDKIRRHLDGTAQFDTSAQPGPASLALVMPTGSDATSSALARGLDPARTIAVDTMFGPTPACTIMATPAATRATRDSALAIFAKAGPSYLIADSPGFVAPRIVAAIVNMASELAHRGIAGSQDIERAIKLALNYPMGPFAMADAMSLPTVIAVLEACHDFYGDPRYRVSPWIKRRAALGLPAAFEAA